MLYEKDKLEQYFREEIQRVSEQQLQALDEEIETIREQTLAQLETSAQRDAGAACEQELRELQSEYAVRLSRLHDETDRRLMKKRNELAESVFSEVIEKIREFTESKDYEALLSDKARELSQLSYPHPSIYVREADLSYADQIRNAFTDGAEVCADDSIRYGGMRLECLVSGIVIDETFDARLNEQKEWFYQNSGLFVK
ncbi:V-type ATP synthase subunit E [Amedibacillus dolichus]|uniref:V-type ATP synthase subunit E n=1 Tax=Amedibacillus dolichus TaxID=31971 RepID=A0ABT7U9E7_9FIRM|nr:V-type ATP synthase subunit E [Amedibacillus dolichus]MDM8156258.1 V-type ATP synthase subunit E [Amedibacillus dolichus]